MGPMQVRCRLQGRYTVYIFVAIIFEDLTAATMVLEHVIAVLETALGFGFGVWGMKKADKNGRGPLVRVSGS